MNYWQRRQKELNKALEKDEARLKKRLSSFYDDEFSKLDKEIAAYYQKYGEENVIQYRHLMESLPNEDKRLLIEQMDEFAKKYPQYAHVLPVRESIYRLNRLEGLQTSIRMHQLEIGAVNYEEVEKHLKKLGLRGANAAAEAMGFGKNFYNENSDIVKRFVNVPWADGKNFSERIWGNTDKLANYLSTDIAQGFARGDSYEKLVKQLRERFGKVNRSDAYRLIYTEGTYVMAEASIQPFVGTFEKYTLSTVGDKKVCSVCKRLEGEAFDIADRQPGVNFPPLHSYCRCTFEIVVDDWDKWIDDYVEKHSGNRKRAEQIEKRLNKRENGSIIKPEEIPYAGIPKTWKLLGNEPDSLKNINPKFKTGDRSYKENCTNCISAYEMRKRGYNVTAKPVTKNRFLSRHPEAAWIDPDIKQVSGNGLMDILSIMSTWPDGARAEIAVTWKNSDSGHVFVAEKEDGKIQFYDVQSGEELSIHIFDRVEKGKTIFWRIDNLEPSDRGVTACEAGD